MEGEKEIAGFWKRRKPRRMRGFLVVQVYGASLYTLRVYAIKNGTL